MDKEATNTRSNAEQLRDHKGDCRFGNCAVCHLGGHCNGMLNKDIARSAQEYLEDFESFQDRDEMLEVLNQKLRKEGHLGRDERLAIVRR